MLQSLYTAAAGLRAQQTCIDVIGNNAANIGTAGFKASRADFAEALYSRMAPQREASGTLIRGSGAIVGAVRRMTAPGTPVATGSPLDFLLDGPGYFAVMGPGGQTLYTRDGSFRTVEAGGSSWLATADGAFVLGADNQPIRLPAGAQGVAADSNGRLYAGGAAFASLGIVAFANPEGLADMGGNRQAATEASGPAQAAAGAAVRQGWLEGSNVDLAGEMVRLIRAQKAYAVLGSAVRTADEMETTANRLAE